MGCGASKSVNNDEANSISRSIEKQIEADRQAQKCVICSTYTDCKAHILGGLQADNQVAVTWHGRSAFCTSSPQSSSADAIILITESGKSTGELT